jgi:hypothetical protein
MELELLMPIDVHLRCFQTTARFGSRRHTDLLVRQAGKRVCDVRGHGSRLAFGQAEDAFANDIFLNL